MSVTIRLPVRTKKLTVPEIELVHGLGRPGCPVCERVDREEREYFFWLFCENYSDPGFLERFEASMGFCRRHAAYALNRTDAASQLTFLYSNLAHHAGLQMTHFGGGAGASDLPSLSACPACVSARFSASFATRLLSSVLQREERSAYGKPGVLCLPHLRALAPALSPEILRRVVTTHGWELISAKCILEAANDGNGEAAAVSSVLRVTELLVGTDPNPSGLYAAAPMNGRREPRDPVRQFASSLEAPLACPVCLEIRRARREWIAWLRDAAATGPDISDLLPLCPEHLWACVTTGSMTLAPAAVRNAFMQERSRVQRTFQALTALPRAQTPWKRLRGARKASLRLASRALQVLESCPPCPVCQRLDEAESRAIILLLALLQEGRHEAALERGHGLCMPHFRRAMAEAGQKERPRLIRLERAKIAALEWELDEARRKGVWSSRPEARGEEQRAWIRALRRFATV